MDRLPDDILTIIANKTNISSMFAWALACVKVAPNIKSYILRNKINKFGWLHYAIVDNNCPLWKSLIAYKWKIDVSHFCTAALYNNISAFYDLNTNTELGIDDKVSILCSAIDSQNPKIVKLVAEYYRIIPPSAEVIRYEEKMSGIIYKREITEEHLDLIIHSIGSNFNPEIYEILAKMPEMRAGKLPAVIKYGYVDMFKYNLEHINTGMLSPDIVEKIIESGHPKLIYALKSLGNNFTHNFVKAAILAGNIDVVNSVAICYGNVPDRYHSEFQMLALTHSVEMFSMVFSMYNTHDLKVLKKVFTSNNIEHMQCLHKYYGEYGNCWSVTGLQYIHKNMGLKLTPDLYISALTQGDTVEIIEYLISKKVLLTPEIFAEISKRELKYNVWEALYKAREWSKRCVIE